MKVRTVLVSLLMSLVLLATRASFVEAVCLEWAYVCGCLGGVTGEGTSCINFQCWWTCTNSCSPSCSGPACGQDDGCGGGCGSEAVGNYHVTGSWCDQNCGAFDCYTSYADPCGNSYTDVTGSGCRECGPYHGPWTACSPSNFQRERDVSYDCREGHIDRETCYGTIYGTIFDASVVGDCTQYAQQPKVVDVPVTATATKNHSTVYPTTTDGNGDYRRNHVLVPDIYTVDYTVDEEKWIKTPPKLLCDGVLTGISLNDQGEQKRRRIGLWRIYGGWFQAQGGDVAAKDMIDVTIPATCVLPANQASCGSYDAGGGNWMTPLVRDSQPVAGTGDPGLGFSALIDLDLAPNAVVSSETAEGALSSYRGRAFDYGYYFGQTGRIIRYDWNGIAKPLGNAFGVIYKSSGNVAIDWDLNANEKMLILHDGDVTINGDIDVPLGSYLGIVASGTITFASNVTAVEGVYMADELVIETTGNKATEQQFRGEGTFVGWTNVQFKRDRGIINNSAPAELFVFRPDFVINAFEGVRIPEVRWQEVAP